jgi:hypothetical protein
VTERITSARELSAYLVEKFRRDGTLPEGVWVADGELILPIGPELDKFCEIAKQLRQSFDRAATDLRQSCDRAATELRNTQAMRATYVPDDPAAFFAMLNRSDDDWQSQSETAVNTERKADRARERALKRSRRNNHHLKKKGKCR